LQRARLGGYFSTSLENVAGRVWHIVKAARGVGLRLSEGRVLQLFNCRQLNSGGRGKSRKAQGSHHICERRNEMASQSIGALEA
jgi:hypothetical protein